MASPFDDVTIRDWFADALFADTETCFEGEVILLGEGPFSQVDLATFLQRFEIEAVCTAREADDAEEDCKFREKPVFVIGRSGWSNVTLDSLIGPYTFPELTFQVITPPGPAGALPHRVKWAWQRDSLIIQRSRSMEHVDIYSQELFLLRLFSQKNPFASPSQILWRYAEDHPALLYLRDHQGFNWASTEIVVGGGFTNLPVAMPEIGILKAMGYTVGYNGPLSDKRWDTLSRVYFSDPLPRVNSAPYMAEWGSAKTATRLKKIADSIAAFCRNSKRKTIPDEVAIDDWEADLAWLKASYFTGTYDTSFRWPDTNGYE